MGVLISSLPMIVCGVLSVLIALSLYDRWDRVRLRLLHFMVTATVLYTAHYVYFNRLMDVIPLTDSLYCFCNPAVYPLYYLYIEELTEYRPNRRRQLACMLPSFLCFLTVGILYLLMDHEEVSFFIQHNLYGNEYVLLTGLGWWQGMAHVAMKIIFALQIPLVLYFGFQRITHYNYIVETNFSNVEGKKIVGVKTMLVLFAATSFASFIFNLIGRQPFAMEPTLLVLPAVLFSFLLLLIGHIGLSQMFSVHDIDAEVFQDSDIVDENGSTSELLERIQKIVTMEKLYLHPNLKVSDLASRLHSNRNYIYHAINVEMGTSFSDYINHLRIDYASQMLDEHPELSINDVLMKSGFTSSSAFYRNFKKFEGITPKEKRAKKELQCKD